MPFAICNEIYQGWPLAKACAHAARTGYQGIELAPFTLAPRITNLSQTDLRHLRAEVDSSGLQVVGLHWLLAHTEGFHVTHPDPAIRQATRDYLLALVDACAELGGRILVFGSPRQRSLLPGVARDQALRWAREVFLPVAARAEARGSTLCIEPLAPAETDFLNTAAEARDFAASIGSPALQIMLDVKAMSSEAIPIPDIIRQSAGRFRHFHANDANLKGPGFGNVDFRPIAAALREVRYTGWVSVEVFQFEEGPEAIAERSLAYLRQTFSP